MCSELMKNIKISQYYTKKSNYIKDVLPDTNVMVVGSVGVGKSTLINAILGGNIVREGAGIPVAETITKYINKDPYIPMCIYDTSGFELDHVKLEKSIFDITNAISKCKCNLNSLSYINEIHAVWYCINSQGGKAYQDAELEFIKKLHMQKMRCFIVLTQCIEPEDELEKFENEINKINRTNGLNNIEIIQVCAEDYANGAITNKAYGLRKLVKITTDETWGDYFCR